MYAEIGQALSTIPLSMSSLEISGLTGKQHGHVIRDIKAMVIGLYGEGQKTFEAWEKDHPNLDHLVKTVTWERDAREFVSVFHLDKSHTMTLVSGYSVKLRKVIVDRWIVLDAAPKPVAAVAEPRKGASLTEALRMINAAARVWDSPVLRQLWLGEPSLPKVSAMYESARQLNLFASEWGHQPSGGARQ